MAQRSVKRRRTSKKQSETPVSEPSSPSAADIHSSVPPEATASSRDWQGWAEIESDPAFFNVMLKELGVKGVAVREIFSLDDEMLAFLPRPVHGVIFLYRWKEDEESVDTRYKPGSKVWFANQTVTDACASYAMLNLVNNIPGLQLGPQLEHFKEFTRGFTPALRGDALANFKFVREIHNSFTRKMDTLNADLHMKEQVDASGQKNRKRKAADDSEDAARHFIAFVPVDGVLWKLDGLEYQPRSLGKVQSDDWLDHVKASIESRMSRYESNEIEFALLGLVQDPLEACVKELASNVKTLQQIEARLRELPGDDEQPRGESVLVASDMAYSLSEEAVTSAPIISSVADMLGSSSRSELQQEQRALIASQAELRRAAKEESALQLGDHAKADKRRHDYGDAIHQWLKMLVRKQALRTIVGQSRRE